jgi:hydrogenase maturation protease
MGDDGVGNYIVALLQKKSPPSNIKIIDCGTDVLKLTSHFKIQDEIILIDALDAGKSPGTIYYLSKDEILNIKGEGKSAHLLSVVESIKLLNTVSPPFQKLPMILIGIQPKSLKLGQGLSHKVKTAALKIVETLTHQHFILNGKKHR